MDDKRKTLIERAQEYQHTMTGGGWVYDLIGDLVAAWQGERDSRVAALIERQDVLDQLRWSKSTVRIEFDDKGDAVMINGDPFFSPEERALICQIASLAYKLGRR